MIHDPLYTAKKLQIFLKENIFGQDIAINSVVDSFKNIIMEPTNTPLHTFLFLGPPATGKTYMAKLIASNISRYTFKNINMSEYQHSESIRGLLGVERGYTSEANGVLTSFVKEEPRSVILFDEFEKAHTNIQRALLSLFNDGTLKDNLGWDANNKPIKSVDTVFDPNELIDQVDFTKTIVIFTSNLGSKIYKDRNFTQHIKDDYQNVQNSLWQELLEEKKIEDGHQINAILPEMLSRLSQGKIVLFNPLELSNLAHIAIGIFDEKLALFAKTYKVRINNKSSYELLIKFFLLQYAPNVDVRRIKSNIYENFIDKLSDYLLTEDLVWTDVKGINIQISKEVKSFFISNIAPKFNNKKLLKYMLRKNITLVLEDEITFNNGKFTYTLHKILFRKINKVSDMTGDGAISYDVPEISFHNIYGNIEIKNRLQEVSVLLKDTKKLEKFDITIPKGMLLYGKPGTGKTMLAKAFANHAKLPFIETSANDLIDFKESGFTKMKEIFERAKDYAPSIIFIDEIDTFGHREKGGNAAVINELLTQINNISSDVKESVFIIAATNYKDNIDPAILRAGRIELSINITSPDKLARKAFIENILKKPCEKNIDLSKLVMNTSGLTGADISKVGNESALYTIRNNIPLITEDIIIEQINILKYGQIATEKTTEEILRETAYHEAGHAIVSQTLLPEQKIEQITIRQRENAYGFVSYQRDSIDSNPSKKHIEKMICILYAGRLAQMKKFGDEGFDTGASSDLNKATDLIYDIVATYGMDDEIGFLNITEKTNNMFATKIEERMKMISKELVEKTTNLVENNWSLIEKLAINLFEDEKLK